ncbi:MAG TPA: transcription elongation factor GreA [Patescibacteria group bacterium]|nr:transcription elongation factor GreA [Patescibacteria group bacterium]
MKTQILLTQEGYDTLTLELKQLKEVKRKKAIDRLQKAREMGDLSENSEYVAAKEELSFIESRILEIDDKLKKAQVTNHHYNAQKVEIGSRVAITSEGKTETYMIVGDLETDIAVGKLAYTSPLGKALIGRKTNEECIVKAPAGLIAYKIISIH